MRLILGSSSKYRQQILQDAGFAFEVLVSAINEKAIRHTDPIVLVRELARAKANAVTARVHEPAIVIASDLVINVDGRILEKPVDEGEARQFLQGYRNNTAHHVNGVRVVRTDTGNWAEGIVVTSVTFSDFPDSIIDQLIREGSVMKSAGSIMAMDPLMQPFIVSKTATPDQCFGLPIELTKQLIAQVSD